VAALFLAGAAAHALSPMRLRPEPDRVRCYGGESVTVRVHTIKGCTGVRWSMRVAGAKTGQGEAVPAENVATFTVRMPVVERRTVVTILVSTTSQPRQPTIIGACSVVVSPPYDPTSIRRLFASASVGVAEARDEVSSRLSPFDCRYAATGGRLALQLFEGDVIVASGEWWRGEGRFLAGALRAQLRRGVRIVVLECEGGGMSFADAPRGEGTGTPAIADPWHRVTGNPALDFRLPGWPRLVPDLRGNLRRLLVDPYTDRTFAVEELPPEGGALLRVSLRVLSSFDDPAAPALLERCVAWAVEAEPTEWKPVGLRVDDEALAERVRKLGIRGREELPSADGGVALVDADGITREVMNWVRAGGTAVVLVPGEPGKAWLTNRRGKILRGVRRGFVRRLQGKPDEADVADDDDPWGRVDLGAERRVLALGLLDEADLGRGKVYVLRVGPPSGDGELPRAWGEFLAQVFTNLGVRLGEAAEDE
jgi:hypothetical protein